MTEPTSEETKPVTYRGNCVCKAFIFEVTVPEIKQWINCNCSLCVKRGYALLFAKKDDFKLVKGDKKDFTSYTFGSGSFHHYFCPTCGIALFAEYDKMPDSMAINIRTLQGPVDVWNLPPNEYDGRSQGSPYVPHRYEGPEPPLQLEGCKVYHGSCHCGDVTIAMKVLPVETTSLDKQRLIECNCSTCHRAGGLWIYPHRDGVVVRPAGGDDSKVGKYQHQFLTLSFCKRCGVWISGKLNAETDEEFAKLPEAAKEYLADKRHEMSVNLRLFDGIDLKALETMRFDGYHIIPPPYVNP